MPMKMLTKELEKKLPKLGATDGKPPEEKKAIVKYFSPVGSATWYGCEYDPKERVFFGYVTGLCPGCDEWGYFSLTELEQVKGPLGIGIERDLYWDSETTMDKVLSGETV